MDLSRLREKMIAGHARLRPEHPSYPWLVLAAISIGTFMAVLDSTIVNVALAKFMVVFGATADSVQWIIIGYTLSFGVMLAASGWIADRFGYKDTFLFGLLLFTAGSFLCSRAWSVSALIAFRAVQGLGGGLIQPVGMAIVTREFPQERRGTALGVWSIASSASISLGPTLGGWIIDNISWHWIFDINVPVGIIGILVGFIVLSDRYKRSTARTFDFIGFISLAVFLTPLLIALSEGNAAWNTDGWTSGFILSCFAASTLGLVVFLIVELTSPHPLIDLSLFKGYNFRLTAFLVLLSGVGMFGSNFLQPLFLQNALGYSARRAGNVSLPMGLMFALMSVVSGRLTDKIGGKIPAVLGILIIVYRFYRYSSLSLLSGFAYILISSAVLGLGLGLYSSPMQTIAVSSMPREKLAQAAGLINVLRQIGGSFGVAGLNTLLTHRITIHLVEFGQAVGAYAPPFRTTLGQAADAARRATGGTTADALRKGESFIADHIVKQAYVAGIDDVYLFAMLVMALALVPIFFMRNTSAEKGETKVVPAAVSEA